MNCDCIQKIEERFVKEITWKDRKILTARIQSLWAIEPEFKRVTSSHVTVTLDGRKNEADIDISHSYCPFCGMKVTGKTEEQKTKI